jgi:hypothetical protein
MHNAAVAVIPVAFRLIDERLMVWVRPASAPSAGPGSPSSSSTATGSAPQRLMAHRIGDRPNGLATATAMAPRSAESTATYTRASLPQSDLRDDESDSQALARLIAQLPFASEVVRVKQCAVFTRPNRVAGRREIALVSWVLVRPPCDQCHDSHLEPVSGALNGNGTGHSHEPTRLNGTHVNGTRPKEAGPAHGSADRAGWFPIDRLPELVDDHAAIVAAADRHLSAEVLHDAVTRRVLPRHLLRSAVDNLVLHQGESHPSPALFGLLPDPFPLSAIRRFYERLLGTEIDRGNFRRKLVELRPTGMLKELPIYQRGVRHRAAQLFTFDARSWERWSGSDESEA